MCFYYITLIIHIPIFSPCRNPGKLELPIPARQDICRQFSHICRQLLKLQAIFSWHSCSFFRYIYIRYSFKREGYEKSEIYEYIMLMHRFVRKVLQKFADKSWKNTLTLQQILGFLRDCPPHVLFLRWFQYLVPGRRLRYGRDWSPSTHPYTPYSTVSSEVVTRLKMKPCPGWEAV